MRIISSNATLPFHCKVLFRIIYAQKLVFCFLLAMVCYSASWAQETTRGRIPNYPVAYELPSVDSIKEVLNRVRIYYEATSPQTIVTSKTGVKITNFSTFNENAIPSNGFSSEWSYTHGVVLSAHYYITNVSQQRIVISTDFPPLDVCMSGCPADHTSDPDDIQSMIRFLLYSNQFDVEALVASSATFANIANKKNILDILELYDKVDENLTKHDPRYPTANYLRSVTFEGLSGTWGKSISNNIGEGKNSEASEAIIKIVDKPDTRPVWFCVWGDCSNIAQAIWKVQQTRDKKELYAFLNKIRIYQVAKQDDTIDWLMDNFPDLFIIYTKTTYKGIFGGSNDSLGNQKWIETNIRQDHGPLGAAYPLAAMRVNGVKEGDSPSFMYLVSAALKMNNAEDPAQESWGGQFVRLGKTKHWVDGPGPSSVSKWKMQYQDDFAKRAGWMLP